ncbi:MAG: CopG family ribbon-helix-helix protein [Euryarchaeota archaeon]|nr:CopG family ribbon-helix-helix protein [Euryarchaeota archaeon]
MVVISVSLPAELLRRIDEFAENQGYTGRSEVIRDAARNLMSEFELGLLEEGFVSSTITAICDIMRTDADEKLTKLRHEFDEIVTSNMHIHIGGKYCLELFITEGSSDRIKSFIGRIRATRGIITVKYSTVPIG